MPKHECHFDEASHTYTIDGNPVPSVTQILGDIIPWTGTNATDWHLDRGRAVHACAAMIARGEYFTNDPQIDGQVAGLRKFFREIQPIVVAVEKPVYSVLYQFAGTLDITAQLNGRPVLFDWKATMDDRVKWQLAAYSIAWLETDGRPINYGYGVQINDDGTYRMSELINLKQYRSQFLAMRTAYMIRKMMKVNQQQQQQGEAA